MKIYAALKIIFKKIIISQHVEIQYNDMRKKKQDTNHHSM